MFKQIIRRTFCVDNKDRFTIQYAKNQHQKKWLKMFEMKDQTKFRTNLQESPYDPRYLEKNEIETRILKILYESQFIGKLDQFKFNQDLRKDLNLDSLNITVLLTSIEHDFTTVFEDRVFQTVRSLEEIVTILTRDSKIF